MTRDREKDKEEEKANLSKKLEKEALEDMKPVKGSPDSLEEGEPSINDVTRKVGKEKEEKDLKDLD